MSERFKAFYLNDTLRKLIALVLAVLVWWIINKQITVQSSASLVIAEVNATGQPAPGTLAIFPPDGWQLAQPATDSETHFWFKGERSRLQQFLESEPAAFFDARVGFNDPGTNQQSTTVEVDASDLRWRRQEDARFFLSSIGAVQTKLQLRFDRRHSAEFMLQPRLIQIKGDAASGYHSINSHLKLATNAITISGPYGHVNTLEQSFKRWLSGNGPRPLILEAFPIDNARNDLKRQLGLHKSLRESGLTMSPTAVDATLPIVLDNRQPVEFVAKEYLKMDTPSSGIWDAQTSPNTWIAELQDHPELREIEFDLPWVERHVRLFLALGDLPEDANEFDLQVQWALVGLSELQKRDLLMQNLILRPKSSEDGIVRMTRRVEQP